MHAWTRWAAYKLPRRLRLHVFAMVRQEAEGMHMLLSKLQALGYSHVHLDARHAGLVASLVDDLISAGDGCRTLQMQAGGQASHLQATAERVRFQGFAG